MRRRTAWLRRDPVGSRPTLLPSREQFRARAARRSVMAGGVAAAALAVALMLRVLGREDPLWSVLYIGAIVFGVAGIASASVALRGQAVRSRALVGLGVSSA